jgi:hypothetical protein
MGPYLLRTEQLHLLGVLWLFQTVALFLLQSLIILLNRRPQNAHITNFENGEDLISHLWNRAGKKESDTNQLVLVGIE